MVNKQVKTEHELKKILSVSNIQIFELEKTDTFGGEANYSWVDRHTLELDLPEDVSDLKLVKLAKDWAGWTGVKCKRDNIGDTIALYPQGMAQVLFITPKY